ncbi:MAG: Uma2 family endonuclease [Bacteroidota bacterium]
MDWTEILEHPSLQDLPFKIETNAWGQIIMSPASNQHGLYQAEIAFQLRQRLPDGIVLTECSVDTAQGVRVADVAWLSATFREVHGLETPYRQAPEVCVEILSPSNTQAEMDEKILLYLARGAREVWLCADDGTLRFYGHQGQLPASAVAPDFPAAISP